MKNENIILNGRNFILSHKMTIPYPNFFRVQGIDDVYGRCSQTKRDIWTDWSNWFQDNCGMCTISSHNSNFFSIEGKVKDNKTGKNYWCFITYANNYCYEMV